MDPQLDSESKTTPGEWLRLYPFLAIDLPTIVFLRSSLKHGVSLC